MLRFGSCIFERLENDGSYVKDWLMLMLFSCQAIRFPNHDPYWFWARSANTIEIFNNNLKGTYLENHLDNREAINKEVIEKEVYKEQDSSAEAYQVYIRKRVSSREDYWIMKRTDPKYRRLLKCVCLCYSTIYLYNPTNHSVCHMHISHIRMITAILVFYLFLTQ